MLEILRSFTKDLFFVRIGDPERKTYEKSAQRETDIDIDKILSGAVGHCTHNGKKDGCCKKERREADCYALYFHVSKKWEGEDYEDNAEIFR
jgi:hypothetical protein